MTYKFYISTGLIQVANNTHQISFVTKLTFINPQIPFHRKHRNYTPILTLYIWGCFTLHWSYFEAMKESTHSVSKSNVPRPLELLLPRVQHNISNLLTSPEDPNHHLETGCHVFNFKLVTSIYRYICPRNWTTASIVFEPFIVMKSQFSQQST